MNFCQDYNIELVHSMVYYPQGNGLAELSNKNFISIIKRMMGKNKKSWDVNLRYVLWVDRISTKRDISTLPYQRLYGMDVVFPLNM